MSKLKRYKDFQELKKNIYFAPEKKLQSPISMEILKSRSDRAITKIAHRLSKEFSLKEEILTDNLEQFWKNLKDRFPREVQDIEKFYQLESDQYSGKIDPKSMFAIYLILIND